MKTATNLYQDLSLHTHIC